jgi:putative ATP-binding cassette transporter
MQDKHPISWIKDAWHLALPYWQSKNKYKSLAFIILVIMFNFASIYMLVLFNKWYNGFYSAIQHYNKPAFVYALYKFMGMAIIYIFFQVVSTLIRKFLVLDWRIWMTDYYLNNWLVSKAYYKNIFIPQAADNPDQRLSEDINGFISLSLNLTLGLLSSVVSLISFVVILWNISGSLDFYLFGYHWHIVGYMVYAALLYSVIGTYITFKIGKPLINLNFSQQVYEANFRYGLMRVREYGENIAFYGGEAQEKTSLVKKFTNIVSNYISLIYRQMKIDIFATGYQQLAIVFPIVVASGRYFAKIIQLGDLMQINSAFGRVQEALSYFVNSYSDLADWKAIMNRLYGFQELAKKSGELQSLQALPSENYLTTKNLTINLPNGNILLKNIQLHINNKDRLLISGKSGSGKTTLLRTLAGLWPYFSGEFYQKHGTKTMFVAQKVYLPTGDLKTTICYPLNPHNIDDSHIITALKNCELDYLSDKLLKEIEWNKYLSIGEQQKIAFCRILLTNPDIIYLDEITSALDEDSESRLYQMLINKLPNSVIISVGHRSTIRKWHNIELKINDTDHTIC